MGSKFFQFHAVFSKYLEIGAPPLGKSWMRHWCMSKNSLIEGTPGQNQDPPKEREVPTIWRMLTYDSDKFSLKLHEYLFLKSVTMTLKFTESFQLKLKHQIKEHICCSQTLDTVSITWFSIVSTVSEVILACCLSTRACASSDCSWLETYGASSVGSNRVDPKEAGVAEPNPESVPPGWGRAQFKNVMALRTIESYHGREIRDEVGVSFGQYSVAEREEFSTTSIPESGEVSPGVVSWCAVGRLESRRSSMAKTCRCTLRNFLFDCQ